MRSRRHQQPGGGRRGGFTLVEVLLSLALLGSLLAALNVFLFSMAELWGAGREERLFEQHARAVTRHVETVLREAVSGPGAAGLEVREVEVAFGRTEPRLAFVAREGGRLTTWPGAALPDVEFTLGRGERGGLVLGWMSRLEERFGKDAPRETEVSGFVSGLTYEYYDGTFRRWSVVEEFERDTETDGYRMPERMRLVFERGTQRIEKTITLPRRGEGVTR